MIHLIKNQRGIALMLVLGALLILSTIAVEFAYSAHVSYSLASAERDRLQAYYLARSGLNLIRLELRVEKQLRTQLADFLKDFQGGGLSADPLCKQIPLSTGLIKGVVSGALGGEDQKAGEGEKPPEKTEEEKGEWLPGAEDFLNFPGDFEVLCDTEERKINLNVFRLPASPTPIPEGGFSLYEEQKNILAALLSQKEFEPLFKGKPDEIRNVVNQIADWADRNDQKDESPGISGGSEDSEYTGPEYHYKVKNGKYTTVSEILLVAGVGDDLYAKLGPQLTVYGDSKLNLCQGSDEIVKAVVFKHSQTPGATPVRPEDDEQWEKILTAVRLACDVAMPKAAEVAGVIVNLVGGNSANLARQITVDNRFYRLEATGSVRESQVRISAVVDTKGNPNLWKTLYFRVE